MVATATCRGFDMYYVYVLQSLTNKRLYTGSTNNLERRLSEHNNGQSKYTKSTVPFNLVYKEEFLTRSEACKRERFLKTSSGRDYLKEVLSAVVVQW